MWKESKKKGWKGEKNKKRKEEKGEEKGDQRYDLSLAAGAGARIPSSLSLCKP